MENQPVEEVAYGPSPRAWGLLDKGRLIFCVRPVHPHVRGDYLQIGDVGGDDLGPSPRAWGLRSGGREAGQVYRSIPTCVGTTESS